MTPDHLRASHGLAFHHPLAFWAGCALIITGVASHMPMFMMGRHTHWQMVGMPMDAWMLWGMAMIPAGVVLAGFGLMPRLAMMRESLHGGGHLSGRHQHFHVADGVPLNREHWKLVVVLVVALAVDVMKPATLGFVMPGMSLEYSISTPTASVLALVALIGTTVGSIVWGRLADVFGRRAGILLSALMFIGTAICGAMPTFEWNLVMCFLMGASAGGMLPIAFTLMAETVPAAHRGWLLVALGGVGTSAGYLLAAGAAATLEPLFSWRVLWLLNMPTGLVILILNRYIPESPRFLSNAGLESQARAVLRKFSGSASTIEHDDPEHPGAPALDDPHVVKGMRALLRGRHASITWGLVVCGVAWGLVNFGFVLWLPVNLVQFGVDAEGVNRVLAQSALLALPGIALVVWMYHRWSSV
ncbi:MAG TPA: MFS transporter, partial [Luteimonas sp.]